MEVIDGQWYMNGLDWDDEGCIHSSSELLSVIDKVGFLPLFSNSVPGFSVEEMTCPSYWFCCFVDVDPWRRRCLGILPQSVTFRFPLFAHVTGYED